MTNQSVIQPASKSKPVITPVANILKDDKAVLVLLGIAFKLLISAIPSLAPYTNDLTLLTFLGIGILVLHQSAEDLIDTWRSSNATNVTLTTDEAAG